MKRKPKHDRSPVERLEDEACILREMRRAVRDALRVHKALGNPIAVWRDGKVVWIPPEKIPV